MSEPQDDFWLFGYGSLIWKPPPHFDQRLPGYIEGYVRRFWQKTMAKSREITVAFQDHRGTPEAPGRVATLIDRAHWETLTDHHDAPAEKVWGAAYHIPASHAAEVRDYLDIREINGYSIQYTPFHPTTGSTGSAPIHCLVYIGLPENPQFVGPQDPQKLAEHIVQSKGPSGENKEYLYMLEHALLELSAESGDEHITDLAARCRQVEARQGAAKGADGAVPVGHPLHRIGSTEEQEEVEK
ncbi:putative glutathione-specific gamma-glutamylcyclotransferase 2 [Lasiodiplodia theobromae]|uniref:glutathione-specific gamma-glutamylcyclotransferase n=1 Tax=Lasiodiplodia theobromae TaxID=45133 RepID=A0A5N5D8U4_9PEZI|nr:putative glutathione-specific gamma-glutamylcyclotransferase 2 [Lasiodiplodia theobromae]